MEIMVHIFLPLKIMTAIITEKSIKVINVWFAPIPKPIDIAIAVVIKYKISVLPAILPKLKFLSKDETTLVKEKKTKGTTISFNKEIKI